MNYHFRLSEHGFSGVGMCEREMSTLFNLQIGFGRDVQSEVIKAIRRFQTVRCLIVVLQMLAHQHAFGKVRQPWGIRIAFGHSPLLLRCLLNLVGQFFLLVSVAQ